ncbi:MAG: fumarylacetoacetate hydrolase family protein [Lentisphaeria bacterium]|nr:fumarylacetoacetate hydrolase family protein [Lentisphaeria bacterium]
MRFCRFEVDGRARYGRIEDDRIRVLEAPPFEGLRETNQSVALAEVRLLAPVQPPNVFAIGANYQSHIDESQATRPERPLIFIKATTAVIGPEAPIVLPRVAPDEVDYEGELAIVIGRRARHVAPEDALDVVFGYTCANDVSARDCQKRLDGQWARAKSFDSFCPLGPWIETDLSPAALTIRTRLNGSMMQDGTTAHMIFDCRFLISYLSDAFTLLPGTLILTGTPDGVGMARTPPVFLRAGDRVEVTVEGIGTLRNPVVSE